MGPGKAAKISASQEKISAKDFFVRHLYPVLDINVWKE